jgi:hypothetical protein
MEKKIQSYVNTDLIDKFPSQYPNKSFFNYVANKVGLEGFLSVAGILAPSLTEKDNGIFLTENISMLNEQMTTRFGSDIQTVERYVNLFCVSDFYLMASDEASCDQFLLLEFANVIQRSWQIYLQSIFPTKRFNVELSENGLFDEDGICITFSQVTY